MLSLRLLLTIAAALAFIFGLGFLLLPDLTVAPFGVVLEEVGALMTRFYGAIISLSERSTGSDVIWSMYVRGARS